MHVFVHSAVQNSVGNYLRAVVGRVFHVERVMPRMLAFVHVAELI
jgi:hypothetical protein